MKYLLMIYADEKIESAMSNDELGALFGEYFKFTDEIKAAGVYIAGEPLEPTTAATTVRTRDGQILSTDGPFAETKEQLGGYYLVDAPNLDEAIKWAAKIPSSRYGSIEVRPVMAVGPA